MVVEEWEIDPMHSGIHFSVRHMLVAKVRGHFDRWGASLHAEGEMLEHVALDVVIDASSIHTGFPGRDSHLRSADFLDITNHPEITFVGTRVERLDAAHLRLTGELTIRGVARELVLEVDDAGRVFDPSGRQHAGFTARACLDRRDFGITWNQALEAGGIVVGNRIDIEIEVEAVRTAKTETPARATVVRAIL